MNSSQARLSPTFYRQWVAAFPFAWVLLPAALILGATAGTWSHRTAGLIIMTFFLLTVPSYVVVIRTARRFIRRDEKPKAWGWVVAGLSRDALAMYGALQLLFLLA